MTDRRFTDRRFKGVLPGPIDKRRYQMVFYGWAAWRRCFFERFEGGMRFIYRWRLAFGPFEIRRWRPHAEATAMLKRQEP